MADRKGIVIDKGPHWAIILFPDGSFKRVKTHHALEVGDFYAKTIPQSFKYVTAAVILLAILFVSIDYYSVKSYAQVSSLVELGVNRWGRVITVNANSEDGQRIIKNIEVKNDNVDIAIEKISSQILQDKKERKTTLNKPLRWDENTGQINSKLEEKMTGIIHDDLPEAVQSWERNPEITESLKKETLPLTKSAPALLPVDDNSDLLSPELDQVLKQTENKLETEQNLLNEKVDLLESTLKNHSDQIDQRSEKNMESSYSESAITETLDGFRELIEAADE